jgi:tight adherence protein B
MNGVTGAALALAAALLVHAVSPRQRLAAPDRRPARVGWTAVAAVALTVTAATLPFSASIAVSILAVTMVWRIRRRNRHRNAVRDGRALAGALEILVGELRIGAHPVRALSAAAADTAGPVGAALSTAAARAGMGAGVAEGLRGAGMHAPLRSDFDRLALGWQLAVDHGLPVSALLRAAQADIVERQRFSSRVRASMAGARATAAILAGLPLLGLALGELVGAAPLAFLCGGGIGGWFLVAGTVLVCCGLLWADHITERVGA